MSNGQREEATGPQPTLLGAPRSRSIALGAMLQRQASAAWPGGPRGLGDVQQSALQLCSAPAGTALTFQFPRLKTRDAGASAQERFGAVLG